MAYILWGNVNLLIYLPHHNIGYAQALSVIYKNPLMQSSLPSRAKNWPQGLYHWPKSPALFTQFFTLNKYTFLYSCPFYFKAQDKVPH